MKKLFEILKKVEQESIENIILGLNEKVDKKGLNELEINNISELEEYIISGRHYQEISQGAEFDVLFSMKHPENYIITDAKLSEIRIGRGQEVDVLPEDTPGECLIKFEGNKPEMLSKLNIWGEQFNEEKNDFLYLTSQPVMNRITELLNK
ncbi:hypothetical protein [Psychroserpens algicola]|uniref:hypothetical protein n=1 Tax=Psychroserpens algicola TaxID=1719034 RepID=UPI001953906D|nr:hypothetical protein [Psychroserpens algicola]